MAELPGRHLGLSSALRGPREQIGSFCMILIPNDSREGDGAGLHPLWKAGFDKLGQGRVLRCLASPFTLPPSPHPDLSILENRIAIARDVPGSRPPPITTDSPLCVLPAIHRFCPQLPAVLLIRADPTSFAFVRQDSNSVFAFLQRWPN